MHSLLSRSSDLVRAIVLALFVLQLAGCSSPEERAKNHYERGMKLFSEHQNAKASVELRNAVRLKRDMIDAWRAMAQIDEANHDWPRVIADLRTIVELAPGDVAARLKLGRLLLLAGASDEALRLASAGLEIANSNADLHALMAAIKLKLENRAEAVRQAQTALQLNPTNAPALMVLAMIKLDDGDAHGALSLLKGTSPTDAETLENDTELQLLRVKLFEQVGDLTSLEATLKRLTEANPQSSLYRRLLVNFYIGQRRFDEAEKGMRILVAANPSDPHAELDLVRFLYTIKKAPSAARDELNDRIKAGGDSFPFQIALANMDLADGHSAIARQRLERLISNAETSEQKQTARMTLAQSYVSSNDLAPAAKQVNDVLSDDPHHVPALKLRALIHLARSEFDPAIVDLREALTSQPRSAELLSLLGGAYERSGLIELADKAFADATRASNFDASISTRYVEFLERHGSLSRAEDISAEVVKRQPANVQVLTMFGQLKLARQNWDAASDVAESIRKAGEADIADQILGAALLGRSRSDEAINVFKAAYNRNPTAAQSMNSLVAALIKSNKNDEATAFLKAVLAKDPKNANALVLLGTIEFNSGTKDQARTRYVAAIDSEPTALVGYQALANFYISQKDYSNAIQVAQTGLQKLPDAIPLRLISARAFELKDDFESAISQYEAILDKQPNNLIALNNLASLLLDQKSDPSSLKKAALMAAALRKSPVAQFKDTLGWASYRQGDYRNAVLLCEEAAAALPDQAVVRYHLGMSFIAVGQPAKASEQLKKALELAPNKRLADDIRSALEKTGS